MKIELTTEERDALLGIVPGPRWKDCCEHAKESYVATFEIWDKGKCEVYDLYVFDQRGRSEVCLRFGDEPGDYISPGNVGQLLGKRG